MIHTGELYRKIYENAEKEYTEYITELKEKDAEYLIDHAYEIAAMYDIFEIFKSECLSLPALTEYAKIEHPLRSAYTYTLKFDDSRMEELKDFILKFGEETSERKANRFYQNPNSPRYNKSFSKAAENGEKYLFIASYNRDMMCMEYFESNISTANHSGKTDDFMKSWVSKFGVGRCKSILAQVINDSFYDGRYEKEVKADVRKYRFGSKDKEYPLIRTNEHPGLINIVYKELMKMEREKTRKNEQER